MFTAQILIIIGYPVSAASARRTMESAVQNAVRPVSLRFALPLTLEKRLESVSEGTLFYDAYAGLADAVSLFTNETHFLLICGPHVFAPRWDQ